MGNLIDNIDKIHTTELGAKRIQRNLNLQTDDVVTWCQEAVKHADIIIGQGKNWYVYKSGVAITINAHSYTVITAHKINAKVRIMLTQLSIETAKNPNTMGFLEFVWSLQPLFT